MTPLLDAPEDAPDLSDTDTDAEREAARRHRSVVLAGRVLLLCVTAGTWEAMARLDLIPAAFIGQPSEFLPLMVQELLGGSILHAIADTLSATLAAFVLGGVLALLTALVLHAWPLLKAVVDPYLNALNALPRVALVPLFIIWFGIGEGSKIITLAFGVFFPTVIATAGGVDNVPRSLIRMGQSFGLSTGAIVRKIVLPGALPAILSGFRVTASIAIVLLVAAEMIGAEEGIGAFVLSAGNLYDTDALMAGIVVLSVIGLVAAWVIGLLERALLAWR